MKGRTVVGAAAVGLYLAVLGCVAWSGGGAAGSPGKGGGAASVGGSAARSHPTVAVIGLPFRGAVIPIQRVDWIDKYMTAMDEVAADGGDTVMLQVDSRQENATSSHIYLDLRVTPTPEKLGELIDHAKGLKLRVVLMPINLFDRPGDDWRGQLKPEKWEDWFDSYRDMIGLFAWVAQSHHVDVLVIGSELVSTEQYLDQWTRTIEHVRKTFKGALTYSANWDHYRDVKFWDQLDMVGMNCYYKLGPNKDVTKPEVETRWRDIQKGTDEFSEQVHKPVFFLEVGWCSLANAASEPWDYTRTDLDADPELQKLLYEAFFDVWHGDPHLGGFLIWQWPPGPPDEKGYTPKGKPAEQVLKDWLAKKPWAVTQR